MKPVNPRLFLLLALAGVVIPYAAFVPWLIENGVDPAGFVLAAFDNRIASFFALDVIVSAAVLLLALIGRLPRHAAGLVVLGTCLVGVSAGFPLFLYFLFSGAAAGKSAAR